MELYNFENWRCRCSCLGLLCTEPKSKEAKAAGELSETAKNFLISEYARIKYDRWEEIDSRYMKKGTLEEGKGIDLLSFIDNIQYIKNSEQLESEFLTGMPDLYLGESIQNADLINDIKCPWSLNTFLKNLADGMNPHYRFQMNGYYSLSGAKGGSLIYTLVSAPESMIQDELYRLSRKMNVIDPLTDLEYQTEAARVEYNMRFDDIDPELRILKFPVKRDDDLIEYMKNKVVKGRSFLTEFQTLHTTHLSLCA